MKLKCGRAENERDRQTDRQAERQGGDEAKHCVALI